MPTIRFVALIYNFIFYVIKHFFTFPSWTQQLDVKSKFLPSLSFRVLNVIIISIWLRSWSSTFAMSIVVIYSHLWVRMYSNVCEILNNCWILVDRLAGVTDGLWVEGVAVVNKYGPTGQRDVSQWGLQRKILRRLASRLKIGMLSRLFSRRPDMLWDVTTLVRPVTGNRSPDNRVSRSPRRSALVSLHRSTPGNEDFGTHTHFQKIFLKPRNISLLCDWVMRVLREESFLICLDGC